jgi:hypothetical protein
MLVVFICLILTIAAPGYSVSLEDLTDPERTVALKSGSLTELQLKNPRPVLVPRNTAVETLIADIMEDLEPGIFVETLYLYKKPAGAAVPVWSEAERGTLFNEALALSTLTGLQYYSSSRKAMRTFYESSVVIDGPETNNPRKDPVYGIPPAKLAVYARQKDLTFGENIYKYEYYTQPDSLIFVQQNLTAMNAGIIPAVGKDKLRSVVAVLDAEEYLLIYAASMAKAVSFPGMGQRIGNSFSTRAEAILSWFSTQADKAFSGLVK